MNYTKALETAISGIPVTLPHWGGNQHVLYKDSSFWISREQSGNILLSKLPLDAHCLSSENWEVFQNKMSFEEAAKISLTGKSIRRASWNKHFSIKIIPSEPHMQYSGNESDDIEADDWVVV